MSDVLDYVRSKDPRFKDVDDDELTKYIGSRQPEFLKDPQFAKDYERASKPEPEPEPEPESKPKLEGPGGMEWQLGESGSGEGGAPKSKPTFEDWQRGEAANIQHGLYDASQRRAQLEQVAAGLAAQRASISTPDQANEFNTRIAEHNQNLAQFQAVQEGLNRRIAQFDDPRLSAAPVEPMTLGERAGRILSPLFGQTEQQLAEAGVYRDQAGNLTGPRAYQVTPLVEKGMIGGTVGQLGPAVHAGGQVTKAALGDLANQVFAPGKLENLTAFAENPDEPLPVEQAVDDASGAARMAGKVALGTAGAVPAVGVAAAGGMAGAPAWAANLAALGFDKDQKLDPVGAVAALGLPFVDKFGRAMAADAVKAQLNKTKLVYQQLVGDTQPQLVKELSTRYPFLEKRTVQKVLEVGGGQLANVAFLTALQTPGILDSEHPVRDLGDTVLSQLALSALGAEEITGKGRSLTEQRIRNDLDAGKMPFHVELWKQVEQAQSRMKETSSQGSEFDAEEPYGKPSEAPPEPEPEPEPKPAPTPVPAAPVPAEPEPKPAPAATPAPPGPNGLVLGRETYVRGANDTRIPAHYAWISLDQIQPSHIGEAFAPNPAYAPLKNTRDYDRELAEREKVLNGASNFDPETYAVTSKGAGEGPVMIAPGSDGVFRVLGGNGRSQMLRRLTPDQWQQFGQVLDQEAKAFDLPPRPGPNFVLARVLPPIDTSSEKGIEDANLMIDRLNPSAGLQESQQKMAENDALKVPALALDSIAPTSSVSIMRDWMRRMIADGVLDRNTRTQILSNEAQLTEYVQRLLVQAAYRDNHVANVRNHPRTLQVVRGLIDGAVPLLINLRQKGAEGVTVANAFTEMLRRVADYQDKYPDRKLDLVLRMVSDQGEVAETPAVTLSRGLAGALGGQVEKHAANKRGEVKIDEGETSRNFLDLLNGLARSVRHNDASGDLLGGSRTLYEVVSDFLRSRNGPGELRETERSFRLEPDPNLKRYRQLYRKLMKAREKQGKLTVEQERELEELEVKLGQSFMNFWHEENEREQEALKRQQQLEAGLQGRLNTRAETALIDIVDTDPQIKLLEGTDYFPGMDAPGGKNPNARKWNTVIPPPAGAAEGHKGPQLELAGDGRTGERRERSRGSVHERAIIEARAELVPPRPRQREADGKLYTIDHTRAYENLARLKPHQRDGVNRIVDAFLQGKNFGLFDGAGAGKTMQQLAVAQVMAGWTGKPVLIITERPGIIDDAFAKDAAFLKIPIHRWQGGPLDNPKGQQVLLATYYDVADDKVPQGRFETIIFDEAHNLRGVAGAGRSDMGMRLAAAAKHVLYATATPLDKPEQVWYLQSLLEGSPERNLLQVGISVRPGENGGLEFTTIEQMETGDVVDNLAKLFDGMYQRGQALKREVPLDNLSVQLRRVEVSNERLEAINVLMKIARKHYLQKGVPGHMVAGLVSMVGRGALEAEKAVPAIAEVERALGEGKKVLLYAYRVADGLWVKNNGLEAIANMLEKKYGVDSVGRLFGGSSGVAGQRYMQQTLARFQHGDLKIIVASPQQAGTGLSADDVYGDFPREIILLTAPLSALETVQIAGRINRLTTASPATLTMLYAPFPVDTWNLQISMDKLRMLRAAVKGDVGSLEPKKVNENATQYQLEARRRSYDPQQTEFNFQRAVAGVEPVAMGGAAGRLGRGLQPPGASGGSAGAFALSSPDQTVYAIGIRRELVSPIGYSFVGQDVSDTDKAAMVFRVARNPSFEIFRWVFVKNGIVVGQYAVSAGRPAITYAMPEGVTAGHIANMATVLGADGILAMHNHPSGNPEPSEADLSVTRQLSFQLHGFLGHIIINGTRYTHISPHGDTYTREYKDVRQRTTQTWPDPMLTPPEGQPFGEHVGGVLPMENTAEAVAKIGRDMFHGEDTVSLIYIDTKGRVRGLTGMPVRVVLDPKLAAEEIRRVALPLGANGVFAYWKQHSTNSPSKAVTEAARQLVEWKVCMGFLRDYGEVCYPVLPRDESAKSAPKDGDHWLGLRSEQRDAFVVKEKEREFSTPEVFSTPALVYALPGGAPATPVFKGRFPASIRVQLGGMEHVHPVDMPELVKLAKELMGRVPDVKKMRRARGMFYGVGSGRIKLNPDIFINSIDAAKTLAHEIGHGVDYLPDQTLMRGNVLGRINVLRRFLRDTFGGSAVTNKQLREELLALTRYWRPYPATSPPSYIAYRQSAVELYADALSVLLNSPGLLQQKCPDFYAEFWDKIDLKPEVKAALFSLQDLLNGGKKGVLEARGADIADMFGKGEEIMKRKAEERELRRKSWKGFWMKLRQEWFDQNEPIIARANQAAAGGGVLTPDPRRLLDEGALVNNTNERLVRLVFETVLQPVEAAGLTIEDLGQYMFLERIMAERSALANPLGITPEAARLQFLNMRLDLGINRMQVLMDAIRKFHDLVFPSVQEAVRVGAYNRTTYKNVLRHNKYTYATFAVLDYLEDYVPASIRQQIGTLKSVANPFTATLLKTVTLNNLSALQRSKRATISLLQTHFPGDIEPAVTRWNGAQHVPVPNPDRGVLPVLVNGAMKFFWTDPLIARAFEKLDPADVNQIVKVLDWSFQKIFYPMFITYNPYFLLFAAPYRDLKRTRRNIGVGRWQLAKAYWNTWAEAVGHMAGVPGDLAREMTANFALGTPFDSFTHEHRGDQFADVLNKYRILGKPPERNAFWGSKPVRVAMKPLEWANFYGSTLINMPKFAAYRILTREMGMAPREAAGTVRNFVGLPNVRRRGRQALVARALLPFWNVSLQGWRADAQLATDPKTRAGWWFRWASRDGVLTLFKALAGAGLLGAGLKELFDGISEYDKTNYNVYPVGYEAGGPFGHKVAYVRMPYDFTSRLLSGVLYKSVGAMAKQNNGLSEIFEFGGGEFPSANPALTIPARWAAYAEGQNPVDPFHGRPIIPDRNFRAGGWDTLDPMFSWTLEQSGAMNFIKWNQNAQSATELALSATPGLNRVVKFSDYGYTELQRKTQEAEERARARQVLSYPDNARHLLSEFEMLKAVKTENRTPDQASRYAELAVWYNQVWRRLDQSISDAPEDGKVMKDEMRQLSKEFEPAK